MNGNQGTDGRCDNYITGENEKGQRCGKAAAFNLINGTQFQGQVCEECGRQIIERNTFLKLEMIHQVRR